MATFSIETDAETYCFLRAALTPEFTVTALPQAGYFAQWLFHYQVSDGNHLLYELKGDFRDIAPGALAAQAVHIVRSLQSCSATERLSDGPIQ